MRLQQIERQLEKPTECASECEMPQWLCSSREHCKKTELDVKEILGRIHIGESGLMWGTNFVPAKERENQARDDSEVGQLFQ